jgi:hypothetical protein
MAKAYDFEKVKNAIREEFPSLGENVETGGLVLSGRKLSATDRAKMRLFVLEHIESDLPRYVIEDCIQVEASKLKVRPRADKLVAAGKAYDGGDYVRRMTNSLHTKSPLLDGDSSVYRVLLRWGLQAVERMLTDEAEPNFTPILKGNQGIGKSGFIKHIAQILPESYSTSKPNPKNIDHTIALGSIFVHELEEIDTLFNKFSDSEIKEFLTKRSIIERKKYAESEDLIIPRTNFIGTTNKEMLLNDPTGNRRFFMLYITHIDYEYLKIDPMQFWGELVHRYWKGERGLLTDVEKAYQAEANEKATDYTLTHEILDQLFVFTKQRGDYVSFIEIKQMISNAYNEKMTDNEIAAALTQFGAYRDKVFVKGQGQKRVWMGLRKRKHNEVNMPDGSIGVELGHFKGASYIAAPDSEPEPEEPPPPVEQKAPAAHPYFELDEDDKPLPAFEVPSDENLPRNNAYCITRGTRKDKEHFFIRDVSTGAVQSFSQSYTEMLNLFNRNYNRVGNAGDI